MKQTRPARPAADVAVGYAADGRGNGVAYATLNTGTSVATVRLPFSAPIVPAFEGLGNGYSAVAAAAAFLRARGIVHVRLRLQDGAVVAGLTGSVEPPKALAMQYVRSRCMLHGFATARVEQEDSVQVRDLTARANAEVQLRVAA